jgi:hypothetical protein
MRVLTHGQNNLKIYQDSQFNIHRKLEDFLLINDIRNDQNSTIGELHYDSINPSPSLRTVFTTDGLDKVVRNEILNSNNRINYNLGYTPTKFTAIFDYKAGGGNGADGAYFYFHAKGTQNPNDGLTCYRYDFELGEEVPYICDSFPNGKYVNSDADAYRIHFDEYLFNEQLAISWGGYQGGNPQPGQLLGSIGITYQYPAGFDFADGIWRNIKIQFNDGFIRVLVDNAAFLEVNDPAYLSRDLSGNNFGVGGYVGGFNNYHYFKNFKFYNIII